MVIINSEGKFGENYYLIDAMTMGMQKFLSLYVVEHNGTRLLIDVGDTLKVRKLIKKLKEFGLYPIHKIVITHSHWDHAQGLSKLTSSFKDFDVEILASENAVENLRHPEKMLKGFDGFDMVYPFKGEITPLKEGDIIDINGLELEVLNLFGHTMDSIGLLDNKNKNIFVGDAAIDRLTQDAFFVPLMPPDFHEQEFLKTLNKLRDMRSKLNSISLAHFGVWTDKYLGQILDEMEDLYFKVKDSLIDWHKENPSIDVITSQYCRTFIPTSKSWNENLFAFLVEMMINGLKLSGFI